jgi:precorrin-6Y C5,15-methyltransferase (decarboxylating)
VTVVGVGADGWAALSPRSQTAIRAADVVVGGSRQLALVPGTVPARRVLLPSPLHPALGDLMTECSAQDTVVLASGDPMAYGIGSTLVRLLGAHRVTVIPHPSSMSLAAARLGWALDDLDVVSLVGRPLALLHTHLQPGRRVLVLVGERDAASEIRTLLADRGLASSSITILSDLGGPDEAVRPADDMPHSRLSIIAVECRSDPGTMLLPRAPGLPDDAFEHDGQITKREIRAMAVAALAAVPGQLLWDVGAGSGSIGIEWMRTHPASRAVAVEARDDRCRLISRNAEALGVPGLVVVAGSAPEALAGLPAPDAVFIGGGVTGEAVADACWNALSPGGRLVAHAVTLESERVLVDWHGRVGGSLTRVAIERAHPLGRFTTWRPALPVVQWSAEKPQEDV